jgi:hypothetical protein
MHSAMKTRHGLLPVTEPVQESNFPAFVVTVLSLVFRLATLAYVLSM